MNLGVLLLSCSDEPRVTTLTRDWVQQATAHVSDYLFAQSGGRVKLDFQVFDWFPLPMTGAAWNALQFNAGGTVRPLVAAALNVSLDAITWPWSSTRLMPTSVPRWAATATSAPRT